MSDGLCIDLCSGLGGFSRAFVDAGWEVVTVDVEPKFKPTICADVTTMTVQDIEKVLRLGSLGAYSLVVVVASPPCERFSLAAFGRGNVVWPGAGIKKALEIVGACLELIHEIQPDGWALENPTARLRWILGRPTIEVSYQDFGGKHYKPTDIWASIAIPLLEGVRRRKVNWLNVPGYAEATPVQRRRMRHRAWAEETGEAPERAKIPRALSQAILEAVERTAAPEATAPG